MEVGLCCGQSREELGPGASWPRVALERGQTF